MNSTNPYAAPVPVEEDATGYVLLKIARLYNRLGVMLKWIILLLAFEILTFIAGNILVVWSDYTGLYSSAVESIAYIWAICLFLPAHLVWTFLCLYGIFIVVRITLVLKYRAPVILLLFLGTIGFPLNILTMFLLRRKAAQILRDGSVEIIGGKVDLAKIPVEEDY